MGTDLGSQVKLTTTEDNVLSANFMELRKKDYLLLTPVVSRKGKDMVLPNNSYVGTLREILENEHLVNAEEITKYMIKVAVRGSCFTSKLFEEYCERTHPELRTISASQRFS